MGGGPWGPETQAGLGSERPVLCRQWYTENLAQPVIYNSGFVPICAWGLCGDGLSAAL